ncbi:MAG: radical SAM protein, partial [Desulfuromonadales bacterium]|nr:radical SAM protein [Desulfuromonadales bacterium]
MKQVIVPFFISHQGCPHSCIFCDQRKISGSSGKIPIEKEIRETIRKWLGSSERKSVDVAFYGGSFTALPEEVQEGLLLSVQPFIKSGEVESVRVSTRPDAISPLISDFLLKYGVRIVELGVQSMNDEVLARAERGHTAADTRKAFAVLKEAGLTVGAQLMQGLPGETPAGCLDSFDEVMELKPELIRLYPVVVLKGTELAGLYERGEYNPLTLSEAIMMCKIMLQRAGKAGVPVIRVGLQPTNELRADGEVIAGVYHPALRQFAESERWYDLLCLLLKGSQR